MMYDFDEPAYHIQRVNDETRGMFSWLRTDKEQMAKAFDTPFKAIDIDLAWAVFDEISYSEIFKETSGDQELLYDQTVRKRVVMRIMDKWPVVYYLRLLKRSGVMDSVETVSGEVFFIKDIYKPSVKTLFTPSSTR